MASHLVAVDAARRNRSLMPAAKAGRFDSVLTADPALLFWRRVLETASDEAKKMRFGEPTDTAILTRCWIEEEDDPAVPGGEMRVTFDRACGLLLLNPTTERVKRLAEINEAWGNGLATYATRRLHLRRRAVLSTAGVDDRLHRALALLVVSEIEYDETAGINRQDPPGWDLPKTRTPKPRRLTRSANATDHHHVSGGRPAPKPDGSSLDLAPRG